MARLLIFVWDEPGQCQLEVMTSTLTAHLHRHDTYHSWFEVQADKIQRRTIHDPTTLRLQPTTFGSVCSTDWQLEIGKTPSPLSWDCFRFGILQRSTGFSFFASMDHLNADSSMIAILMHEIHAQYRATALGQTAPQLRKSNRYLDYCADQSERLSSMNLSNPEVSAWLDFLLRHEGRMPSFPLPLGVLEDRSLAEHIDLEILDDENMRKFEASCELWGARVIGGLLASAAITERELTGSKRYSVVTPTSMRKSPGAFRMSGWCMGLVPIDFDTDSQTAQELALMAQQNYEKRLDLARVPIERVLELASEVPAIRPVATGGVMLSYMDLRRFPLNTQIAKDWHATNGRIFINQGMAAQVSLWLFRTACGLSLTLAYPANETARSSMKLYADAFKSACRQVVAELISPKHG